jgi:hypothetical protein
MRKLWFLAVVVWLAAVPARVDAQFFSDNFDSYVTGSQLAGQGGWELWDLNPAADATIVDTQAFDPPNSVEISGTTDIIHQFTGVTSGTWTLRLFTYIPSTQSGESFVILLNAYEHGIHNLADWSSQVVFCVTGCLGNGVEGMVASIGGGEVPGGGLTPLILDQWVELRAVVDLDANQYQLFYNGRLFETQQWTITGAMALDTIDFFSNGSTATFIDQVWLDSEACEAAVQVRGDVHTPGSALPVRIHIAHNRPETVTVAWELSLINPEGRVVAKRVTPPHTFEPGDVVDKDLALTLPEDLEAGTYTLRLRISGMHGTEGATTTFRVVPAR